MISIPVGIHAPKDAPAAAELPGQGNDAAPKAPDWPPPLDLEPEKKPDKQPVKVPAKGA